MHQSQIEQFTNAWTKQYVRLLSIKKDILNDILKCRSNNDVHGENVAVKNLTTINYQIELAIVEHDIFTNGLRHESYPNMDVN